MKNRYTFLLLLSLATGTAQAQTFTNVIVENSAYDGECTVLINPANTQNVIASRNADLLFRSFDGGLTWQDTNMSSFSSQTIIGDVALAADQSGKLYFQALDGQYLFRNFVSNNSGVTWGTETAFGDIGWTEDKNWLTCDRVTGSAYNGRVYCAWTRRSNGQPNDYGYIFLNSTSDGGQTWSARETLDVVMNQVVPPIGTGLACGPGGSINVTWGGGTPNRIYFKKSTDGGLTWQATPVIVDNNVQPAANYYASITHPISFSAQFTSLACDVSGGAHNGNLYCVWDDIRNGTNNADIFLAKSTDGGTTWTTQRINDDVSTRNQVVPTVAVDPSSGWVYVSYLDARTNLGGPDDSLHYYLAFSSDGGQTFTNVRVSNQLSTTSYIHSDYMGMDAINGNIGCLWVGGLQSTGAKMWYAPIQQSQLVGIAEEESDKTPPLLLYPATPNPAIDFTAFDFQLAENDNVTLTITDINGRAITTLLNKAAYTSGRHQVRMQHSSYGLATGMYVATITTGKHTASRKFTVYK